MNLFQKLQERRMFQIIGGYIAGGWAIIQFLEFLEGRMTISPHLVNLVGLSLLLLLPTMFTLAWVHGRPGKDNWGRISRIVIPTNLIFIVVLGVLLFKGEELGAVTTTIAVEDENGAISERVVPKNVFRRRVILFYPENIGSPDDDWARETVIYLQTMDLSQDHFLDPKFPADFANALQKAGSVNGHDLNRSRQRKIARDSHIPYFTTGTINHQADQWTLTTELHESKSGRELASRSLTAPDLFTLVDLASRQLREDLGIPAGQLADSQDLPVAELTSFDLQAVESFVKSIVMISHHNDWQSALPLLEEATSLDPHFAMAQLTLYAAYLTLGQSAEASTAIASAMENLYQLPERTQFQIKSTYYYNEKQDPDKTMAILQMWTQLYPNDVDAHLQLAQHYYFQQDLPHAIAAYEAILAIDPSQVQYLQELANLHSQLGQHDQAERYLRRYVEIFPTRADGYRDLARLYSNIGHLEKARTSLERAQLLDPADLSLILDLIGLDIKAGHFGESKQALESELERTDTARERASVLARQSNLALLMGQTDLLIEKLASYYLTRSEYMNPMQADLMYAMMIPLISSAGKPEVVLSILDQLSAKIIQPYDKMTGVSKAWALADLGRLEEAAAALADADEVVAQFKFEALRPALAEVNGIISEAGGDLAAATEHYRTALETTLQPSPRLQVRLAHALRLQGKLDEAKQVLTAGLALEPSHPETHLEMAFVMSEMGDITGARGHLERAQVAWTDAHGDFLPAQKARELAATF